MKKKVLISTGGSGGHVVPATIFYEHLKNEFDVILTSDDRGINFFTYICIFDRFNKIKLLS